MLDREGRLEAEIADLRASRADLSEEFRQCRADLTAALNIAEASAQECEKLRSALRAVEAHHVKQNGVKGRDERHSYTLRVIRAALALEEPPA